MSTSQTLRLIFLHNNVYLDNDLICRDLEPTAVIQQALSGDNIMEKERKVSELILQLQMVREQLLEQQEPNKVSFLFLNKMLKFTLFRKWTSIIYFIQNKQHLLERTKCSRSFTASEIDWSVIDDNGCVKYFPTHFLVYSEKRYGTVLILNNINLLNIEYKIISF